MQVPSVIRPGAKIFILGEAPGAEEAARGQPFVGAAGKLLRSMLTAAGLDFDQCSVGNVFSHRPPDNNLDAWCVPRTSLPKDYNLQPLSPGKYLHPDHLQDVIRALTDIEAARPNLVVALGNTACWALLRQTGIGKLRGFVHPQQPVASPIHAGLKVLPTYHPAAVLRQWSLHPTAVLDLIKARSEAEFPTIRRPARTIYIPQHPWEILDWWLKNLGPTCAIDIETAGGQITCIGFAFSPETALVVPFEGPHSGSYWTSLDTERAAWHTVAHLLADTHVTKVFQGGIYDLTYLTSRYGLAVRGPIADLLILHHAQHPELPKSLAHLGSIYTSEAPWKLMRARYLSAKKGDIDE